MPCLNNPFCFAAHSYVYKKIKSWHNKSMQGLPELDIYKSSGLRKCVVYSYVCSYVAIMLVLGLCDNDKTYISITPPKFISINDIISITFLHTI